VDFTLISISTKDGVAPPVKCKSISKRLSVKGGMRQGCRTSTAELVLALRGKYDGVIPPRRSHSPGFAPRLVA